MLGWFLVGALAAFGALCVLWVSFGWLLPQPEGFTIVCWGMPEPETFTRFWWLRSLGLLQIPLLIVAEGEEPPGPGTEIISREALLFRLEQERREDHGTGNGDHTGHCQCGDLSEL